jgi:hypothetical protein
MIAKRLAPNQFIFTDGDKEVFQSYDTVICTVQNGVATLTEGQPQSRTTGKYLNQFLQLFTNYSHYKQLTSK